MPTLALMKTATVTGAPIPLVLMAMAGSVLEDLPGMVDGSGTAQSLVDTFTDRTKMALVLSNAFET